MEAAEEISAGADSVGIERGIAHFGNEREPRFCDHPGPRASRPPGTLRKVGGYRLERLDSCCADPGSGEFFSPG
jgi:hypothetical protein